MTDKQFLTAVRSRASRRLSNFLFLKIIDELISQSNSVILEKDVIERFKTVAEGYDITFDEFDIKHMQINRPEKIIDEKRIIALHKAGFCI